MKAKMTKAATLPIDIFFSDTHHHDFYVNRLSEHLKTSHVHISKPHKHDFYAFLFFTEGEGVHDIDFRRYDVLPGSLFLMSPGQTHSWNLSDDAEGFVFFHTPEFYDLHGGSIRDYAFFKSLNAERHAVVAETQRRFFNSLLENMLAEYAAENRFREKMLASYMTSAYITADRLIGQQLQAGDVSPQYLHTLDAFENLLEAHFKAEKSVGFYAEKLHVTSRHLNRICQLAVGKTTGQLISERVILEAKRLLTWSNEALPEIAAAIGYDDYAHFSKLFRSKTGFAPTGFAKKYR